MSRAFELKNPRLLEALQDAERASPYLERAMFESVQVIKDIFAQYPPESEANRPGRTDLDGNPLPYYERGRGSWRPIKAIPEKLGVSLGVISSTMAHQRHKVKRATVVLGYRLRPSSQQLGKNWVTQVIARDTEILGVIGNHVTYADYVNGFKQAAFHEARNWPDPDKALEQGWPDINDIIDRQIDLYIQELPDNE